MIADSGRVRRLTPDGVVATEAQGLITNSTKGLTTLPGLWGREQGVATDPQGNAVIVDPAAGRIVLVARDGRATPLWQPAGWAQRLTGGRWGWRPSGVAMMGATYYVVDEWIGPALLAEFVGSPRVSQVDAQGHVTRIAAIGDWGVRGAALALLLVLLSIVASRRRR